MRIAPIHPLVVVAVLSAGARAWAADAATAIPRFASLGSDKVYMREGPTYRHPILWVYRRKGLPVEVVGQFDVWRKVRDSGGTTGWVHSSMISDARTVVVTSKAPAAIRPRDDRHARILALAQPGVVAKLEACSKNACEIAADGTEGWIDKKNIWGVKPGEVFR